jgi:hypothetical protein
MQELLLAELDAGEWFGFAPGTFDGEHLETTHQHRYLLSSGMPKIVRGNDFEGTIADAKGVPGPHKRCLLCYVVQVPSTKNSTFTQPVI